MGDGSIFRLLLIPVVKTLHQRKRKVVSDHEG